ncbi:MAG: ATP-binding SpoIIE family protein phosphatase [Pseudomonadota bacterium]
METILGVGGRQTSYPVAEASQVAAARRAAGDMAARLGFNETGAGQVAIVVTEAAGNIVKHASHGEIVLRQVYRHGVAGIEILALDRGPGIRNLAASMADGTSTAGSYGVGLGAMRRLSQEFDIYTTPGKGTVLGMVLWVGGAMPAEVALQSGAVCLPLAGEHACGDAWALTCSATSATVLLADGLGHGPNAAQASELAAGVLQARAGQPPGTLMQDAHDALRGTRGAAVAVAVLDAIGTQLQFCGIGNIAAHVYDGDGGARRQMVSHNGIVGSNMRKVQEFATPWPAGAILILHSDGLATRWDLADYAGVFACHPRIIAALLYRDFARGRDDVTVLVLRDQQEWVQ